MTVDMGDLVEQIQDYAREIVTEAATRVLAACKEDCPVSEPNPTNDHSGRLRDSLEVVDLVDDPPIFGFSIVSELEYASYTDEQDTGVHEIAAKYAPLLRFWWEDAPAELGGPNIYYFKRVTHPGTKGQHWFASRNEERFDDALQEAVDAQ